MVRAPRWPGRRHPWWGATWVARILVGGLAACGAGPARPPALPGADGGDDASGPMAADAGDSPDLDFDPGTPELPPRGAAALEAWLAEGHHLGWKCELQISPPRLGGNHGRQRICSNRLLLGSVSGFYPVGAASVKELFDLADQPNGFAVGRKIEAGEGPNTWYWYQRVGPTGTPARADGPGIPDCAVCHGLAGRDYVYVRAE